MIPRNIILPKNKSFFLFGPRQTGKSTLIHSFADSATWTINLLLNSLFIEYSKDPALFRRQAMHKLKNENISTIVIDEVQRIPELLSEVHALIDEFPLVRFILTGSSARKLKRGGADLLAGRAIERKLFPLTYTEIPGIYNLESVLLYGTLPPVITAISDEDRMEILNAYTITYLSEEIKSEGLSRNIGGFTRFLELVADYNGELTNFSAVSRECALPIKTVQSYYEILEDTLIGYRLLPWLKSPRKRMSEHPKFYLFDTGVCNALCRRLTTTLTPSLLGRAFENLMVIETLAAISYGRSEARIYFWRTSSGAEVDMIIEKHGRITGAFEFKTSRSIGSSDLSGLLSFATDYPETPLHVVSTNENAFILNGVKIIPWKEFIQNLKDFL